ncbi:sigma-70 family RNA polymerase sigma factor [bacterium LRH843]|nr:sigma-70 family RNA polymerase sigma factor [bacterium LRH843]
MKDKSFEEILTDYKGLIKNQIKKLNLTHRFDEFYQVGVIGLWQAYERFQDGKGAFPAYALQTVRGHMLMALRSEKRFLDKHVVMDKQTSLDFNQADPSATIDVAPTLSELIPDPKLLTPRERLWVQEAIILGKKLGEIAEDQGVSKNTVSSWRKQAVKRLREVMDRNEV